MTLVRASGGLAGPATGQERALARLRKACGEFEGFLLAQMMQVMRQNCLESDFMSGGLAEEVFTDQMLMALGAQLGERSGLGIARMLYEQMAPAVSSVGAAAADRALDAGPSGRVSPPTAARPPARPQPMIDAAGRAAPAAGRAAPAAGRAAPAAGRAASAEGPGAPQARRMWE